ncbi:hypothetical protein GOP47_0020227 [Adiantum capillus-veneris]|uniref:BCAS3 domain-containing protein n=1 Tax=Adiantum capillus-veneris TaxID=13818 RepID=A0A9D4UD93_ADICA|nr:hypothetical protein GOP47_0020227 [Adiantum capillus-veneris]
MSNGGLPSRSQRAGRSNSFLPTSIRAIFRGATSLASTVRSAGTSVASSISSATDDHQREQVQWAGFDMLEFGPDRSQRVLLLTYVNGFQVWNVEDANDVWELVSKRDGPVALLRAQPQPISDACDTAMDAARPLLLVVTSDATVCRSNGIPSRPANGYNGVVGSPPAFGENHFVPTLVKFYSFRSYTYVHTLKFRSAIHSVRCSIRIVAVATAAQIYCFDAATLENTFSVITYPSPPPGPNGLSLGYGPMAVGSRWLAYAPNQPLLSNTGRVSPQHLSPSPGVSPSTSPANGSLVAYYAKESGKQFAAGIVTLGDLGYKAFSKYCTDGLGSPEPGSPLQRNNCNLHAEHAGTVHVRDFVSRVLVAQFRAHDSPLSALCFDHTGTLLVTASIHGHNINVFRILPGLNTNGIVCDATASHAHLYKLSRGVTNAIIQDIAFSEDGHWIVVSSSRGTNHLFCISPFGGMAGPLAHSAAMALGPVTPMRVLPWWCSLGPVKSAQQASSPPPPTVSSSVVSRIKNGNAGWRGTVSGAAAAASGRSSSSMGAVAVLFHDGRGHKHDAEANQTSLKEQLWVLSPSGHLIRYAIHLSAVTEGFSDGVTPAEGPKDSVDLRVVVEPLEKWDISRKPNQYEREEKLTDPNPRGFMHDTSGSSGGASMPLCCENGKDEPIPDEMHRLFLSKAEVQMHHFRPPLWAKSQISFHVFGGLGHDNVGGEVEIEKVPTRMVEVRKRDLVPVYDRLKTYQFGDDTRERNDSWGGTSSSHYGINYGFIRADAGGIPIQRSSSGSSCGSEGSLCSGPLQNGVHHAYQESFPYHQPIFESKQRPEQSKLQETSFSGIGAVVDKISATSVSTVGSPLYVFPCSVSHDGASNLHVRESASKEEGHMVKLNSCSSDTGSISNGYLGGYNRMSSVAPRPDSVQAEEGACHPSVTSNAGQASPRASQNVEGKFDLQNFDAATEDVVSTDGNSKSEDFGGEQAEDGWEGALFPFAEDC